MVAYYENNYIFFQCKQQYICQGLTITNDTKLQHMHSCPFDQLQLFEIVIKWKMEQMLANVDNC